MLSIDIEWDVQRNVEGSSFALAAVARYLKCNKNLRVLKLPLFLADGALAHPAAFSSALESHLCFLFGGV